MRSRVLLVIGLAAACRSNFDERDAAIDDDAPAGTTLVVTVDGNGTVTSTPPGIACPPDCTAAFAPGTAVTLTEVPQLAHRFLGWDANNCYTGASCAVMVDAATAPVHARFTGAYNVAFVTSSPPVVPFTRAVANAKCNMLAGAVGLPGNYTAWVSFSGPGGDANAQLGAASGWVALDGYPFAATKADLLASTFAYPLRLDERGQINTLQTFTGTRGNGTLAAQNCAEWGDQNALGTTGVADATDATFSSISTDLCTAARPIYCFGTDHPTPVPVRPATGRLAFLSTPWSSGGGIASADARCQMDATLAGLAGTFKAALATSSGPPESRFDLTKSAWVRRDGRRLVPVASMLGQPAFLYPLDQLANGAISTGLYAFTGDTVSNCGDWTDSSSNFVDEGSLRYASRAWTFGMARCFDTQPVYCLQE